MKNILQLVTTLLIGLSGIGQTNYKPTDTGSKAHFVIKNFGAKTGGNFTGLDGEIQFDPAKPAQSSFSVLLKAATVNTGNNARDNHLRKEEYFNVEKYPTLSFKSNKIEKSGKSGQFIMSGDLTIKGVTKAIQFPFSAKKKNNGYLFEGAFEINRLDFKVGDDSISMQNTVKISLSIFAKTE